MKVYWIPRQTWIIALQTQTKPADFVKSVKWSCFGFMERVFSGRLQYRPEGDEKTQHAVSYLTHICLKGKIYLLKIFLKLGWRWSVQHRDMGLSHSLCPFVGVFVAGAHPAGRRSCTRIMQKHYKTKQVWGESKSPICFMRSVPTSHQKWVGWRDPTPVGTLRAAACCVATGWMSSWLGQDLLYFQRV